MDKDLTEELNWIQLPKDLEVSSNKKALKEIKEILVWIFTTIVYRISSKKVYNSDKIDTSANSAEERTSSSVLK